VIVKICGVTRPEDAAAAVAAGADWLGLNFWPRSKRALDRVQAAACAASARAVAAAQGRKVALVGVFVNQPIDEMADLAAAVGLDLVQLHGDEPPDTCPAVRAACQAAGHEVRIIRAVAVRTGGDVAAALIPDADILLVDAISAGYGGSGQTADWSLAAALVSAAAGRPVLLAGGLSPDNVAAAVARVAPAGVDVASGVELAPGVKDAAQMQAFVRRARAAAAGQRAHAAGPGQPVPSDRDHESQGGGARAGWAPATPEGRGRTGGTPPRQPTPSSPDDPPDGQETP
jgi:phosphoribosylanthranilate isomerase